MLICLGGGYPIPCPGGVPCPTSGGYPIPGPGGVPHPRSGGRVPHPRLRGYPIPGLGGLPPPMSGGYPISGLRGTPSQGGGTLGPPSYRPGWGTPQTWPGYPPGQTWDGVPPYLDLRWGTPHPDPWSTTIPPTPQKWNSPCTIMGLWGFSRSGLSIKNRKLDPTLPLPPEMEISV